MTSSSEGAASPTFSSDGPAVHGEGAALEPAGAEKLAHDGRHAAGAVIVLGQVFAGRLAVDQQRQVVAHLLPVLERELDAHVARDRVDVDGRVGGTADGAVDRDRVLEGGAGQDPVGRQALMDHRDDAPAGLVGVLGALLVGRRRRGRARQRHAQRLGERVHGRCRSHGVAMAGARRRRGDHLDELGRGDVAAGQEPAGFPEDGPGTGAPAPPPAVQHRTAIERDRRQVRGRRPHDHRRRGLVASRRQDDAVDRIAVQDLDQAQIGKIAVDRGGRPATAFLDGMNRKFERDAARLADAGSHPFRQALVDAVAGREVGTRLRDPDDGLAGLQLLAGQPEVHVALDIERGHAGIERIVEPASAAQPFAGHGRTSHSVRFAN